MKRFFPQSFANQFIPSHILTQCTCVVFISGIGEPFRLHNNLPANQRICYSIPFPARPISYAESQSPRPRNDEKHKKKIAVVNYYQLACSGRTICLFYVIVGKIVTFSSCFFFRNARSRLCKSTFH